MNTTFNNDAAWSLANAVRADLDRKACPGLFMDLAMESINRHFEASPTLLDKYCADCRKTIAPDAMQAGPSCLLCNGAGWYWMPWADLAGVEPPKPQRVTCRNCSGKTGAAPVAQAEQTETQKKAAQYDWLLNQGTLTEAWRSPHFAACIAVLNHIGGDAAYVSIDAAMKAGKA